MVEIIPSSKDRSRKGKNKHIVREGAFNQPQHLHPEKGKSGNLKGRSQSLHK